MVKYKYDGLGNHEAEVAAEGYVALAEINPFRYRGYYYDTETGLYYLNTRYYDPEVGRFISRDSIDYATPETINGLNLYAYCGNNPVMYVDNGGCLPVPIWSMIVGALKDIFASIGGALLGASVKSFAQIAKLPMYLLDDMGVAVFNPAYLHGLTKATNLQYNGKIISGFGKVANIAGYILLAVDIGLSIYNNITNPSLSTSRKITDSIVDVGFSIGSFFAAISIGAAIGSAIPIPIVGTIIGALVSAAVSLGVYFFQQSNVYQELKMGFNTFITQTIPNAWNNFVNGWNTFWSFGWV